MVLDPAVFAIVNASSCAHLLAVELQHFRLPEGLLVLGRWYFFAVALPNTM